MAVDPEVGAIIGGCVAGAVIFIAIIAVIIYLLCGWVAAFALSSPTTVSVSMYILRGFTAHASASGSLGIQHTPARSDRPERRPYSMQSRIDCDPNDSDGA